jgi:hypothetical protein
MVGLPDGGREGREGGREGGKRVGAVGECSDAYSCPSHHFSPEVLVAEERADHGRLAWRKRRKGGMEGGRGEFRKYQYHDYLI